MFMQNALAYAIYGSDIGTLLWMLVGVILALAIVGFIMWQVGAPPMAYKILWVIVAVIGLLFVIGFFFGGPSGHGGSGGDVHIGR